MALTTTSSHPAPASARSRAPSTVIAALASRTTVSPVSSSAITTLDPPASTRTAPPASWSRVRRVATIWSLVVQVMTRRATGPTRKVVSDASGTCSATTAPPKSSEVASLLPAEPDPRVASLLPAGTHGP